MNGSGAPGGQRSRRDFAQLAIDERQDRLQRVVRIRAAAQRARYRSGSVLVLRFAHASQRFYAEVYDGVAGFFPSSEVSSVIGIRRFRLTRSVARAWS